jgi:hypothetical protein
MPPDATSCTALTSALYSTVSEEEVLHRQLKVEFSLLPNSACMLQFNIWKLSLGVLLIIYYRLCRGFLKDY